MPPDCLIQPLRQHNKRLHHLSRIGTMVQKYNWISLKFNDLRFAYFGETVNERNEMDIELISFIAMLEISFWQDITATLILDYSEVGLSRGDKCIHR